MAATSSAPWATRPDAFISEKEPRSDRMTPDQERQRCSDIKTIGGILAVAFVVFLGISASKVGDAVATVNQVAKVAPIVVDAFDKYQKEEKEHVANALRDVSLTPYKVTPTASGVHVMWKIDNKSDRE